MDLASIAVAATEATTERTVLAVARLDSPEEEEDEEEAIFGAWNWVLIDQWFRKNGQFIEQICQHLLSVCFR